MQWCVPFLAIRYYTVLANKIRKSGISIESALLDCLTHLLTAYINQCSFNTSQMHSYMPDLCPFDTRFYQIISVLGKRIKRYEGIVGKARTHFPWKSARMPKCSSTWRSGCAATCKIMHVQYWGLRIRILKKYLPPDPYPSHSNGF